MRVNMYTLKIMEVSIMDKTKLNLERLRAYDAEWEEDKHPRAENCREMIRKAKAQGKSKASQEWGEALIKANKQVTLLNAIGEAMRK